ncbi:MAG: hypothetical protein WAV67_05595 [Dokdonella sp.]
MPVKALHDFKAHKKIGDTGALAAPCVADQGAPCCASNSLTEIRSRSNPATTASWFACTVHMKRAATVTRTV